jgi:hypothetical protein
MARKNSTTSSVSSSTSDKTEVKVPKVKKEIVKKTKEELLRSKERIRKMRKNRNEKRYSEIFKISKSKFLEKTGKKLSTPALEMLENQLMYYFKNVGESSSKFTNVILKKKRVSKDAVDAQLEKIRIKSFY